MTVRYMQNREISWLRFNERVLEEASEDDVPLLEKLKFISIFTSNLDEFFMIRVGSLHTLASLKKEVIDNKSGMTPKEQIDKILEMLPPMMAERDRLYKKVSDGLKEYDIEEMKYENLNKDQKKFVKNFYNEKIDELVSPQIIDKSHPFPFLENNKRYIIVDLKRNKDRLFGLIPVRNSYPGYLIFPGDRLEYMTIDRILEEFADKAFPGFEVLSKHIISVTRNFDLSEGGESKDEFEDYREYMKATLKKRKRQEPVRLQSQGVLPKNVLKFLLDKLDLVEAQYFPVTAPIRMDYVFDLIDDVPSSVAVRLLYEDFEAFHLEKEPGSSMIEKIRKKDRMLIYPFDHVDAFLELLKEAADDPQCASIKITIYRLAKNSKVVKYLARAAENGKEVSVMMELKARFDEARNIRYSSILYEAGCNIIYGFPDYKTHSKVCLLTFRDKDLNYSYITQFGSGNYNETTAKQYTDFCYFTSSKVLGLDAVDFFKNMAVANLNGKYGQLLQAPTGLKQKFLTLMDQEIEKGEDGFIFAKFNSLTDRQIIDKLVEASKAGVEIKMVVRGICCILPGIPGVTENIEIHSIVGRFLEHTRLYVFGRGDDRDIYISSADLMTRNMERRVEVAVPVEDPVLQKKLLEYGRIVFRDTIKGRRVNSKGEYERLPVKEGEEPLSSQDYLISVAEEKAADQRKRLSSEEPVQTESFWTKLKNMFH